MIQVYSTRAWPCILICIFAVILIHGNAVEAVRTYKKCLTDHEDVVPKKYAHFQGKPLTIYLDMSSRITHMLTTHVFRIFLTEAMGYERVEIVKHEDHFNLSDIMDRLTARESLPKAWINLEVWVPPEFDTFSKNFLKEYGNVAPPGRFGWFVPLTMAEPIKKYFKSWSDDIREVHWEFFKHPTLVKPFEIDEKLLKILKDFTKDNNGKYFCPSSLCDDGMYIPARCKTKACAVLLTADYESTSFINHTIDTLGLYVKVLWLGDNLSNATKIIKKEYYDTRKNAYREDKSMIVLSWTPSDVILHDEDYISVAFKHCDTVNNFTSEISLLSDMDISFNQNSLCKYEMHRLVKFAWSNIKSYSQPLDDVLLVFKFADYRKFLDMYRHDKSRDIEDIACEWMKENEQIWSTWKSSDNKIFIGGIFPITGSSYNGKGIVVGAKMATDAINKNSTVLPNYHLELKPLNGECKADSVMKSFIDFIVDSSNSKKILGVLGPACSDTVEPLAGVSKHYHMIVISYSAEGATFSDRVKYPYFFRTIGENQHYKHVYLKLMQNFKWKRVAALTEDGQKYTEYISSMQDELEKNHINFITNKKFPRDREPDGMTRYLEDLKSKTAKIIIADVVDSVARTVMCEAYKLKMTAREGYVWFLPIWLNETWYNTDYFNLHLKENVNCSIKEMLESINGYFSMTHAYFASNNSLMQEGNKTVREWREEYANQTYRKCAKSDYAGFAYDAVWTYAYALDNLSRSDPEALSDLHSDSTTKKLVSLIEKTDFHGVSGRIKFRGGPSRFSIINILQFYDGRLNNVGNFTPNISDSRPDVIGGRLVLLKDMVKWFTKNGEIPDDGTLPNDCALESLALLFGVECTSALIILNVIAAILAISVLTVLICLWKWKFERKFKQQQEKIKTLEMDARPVRDVDKWEIPRENVVINRKLGEGAFGTVYGGEAEIPGCEEWLPVAVKTLKVGASPEEKLDFLSEADVMKKFDHENIVKLLGVCTQSEPVYTVMEFMLYGDLKTFLLARRHLAKKDSDDKDEVSALQLTSMALDVARGLSYLAEQKYVHRDIASRNCLVNTKRVVKIGDFGMTRQMTTNDYYKFIRKGMLPVRWMAPESLGLGVFTAASDVWSYGVLLYEIITFGSFPFQGKSNAQVLELVKEGGTLQIPSGVRPQLRELIVKCWRAASKDRHTASEIVDYLGRHPRLLEPCLDVPLSSVELENSDPVDISQFTDFKKRSNPFARSNSVQNSPFMHNGGVHIEPSTFKEPLEGGMDSGINIPMDSCCPKQPLLGPSRSNSAAVDISKYVTINHNRMDSGCQEEEDEYINSRPNGHIDTKV